MNDLYRQHLLREIGGQHGMTWTGAEVRCWLPDTANLRIGSRLTLKEMGDDREWVVVEKGQISLPKDSLYKPWHVGGL